MTDLKREFPVFGYIENYLVTGFIDRLAYEQDALKTQTMEDCLSLQPKRQFVLSDVKTRMRGTIPKIRDSRGAEMQLSLYHLILSSMIEGKFDTSQLCAGLNVDPDRMLSDGFLTEASSLTESMSFDLLVDGKTLSV